MNINERTIWLQGHAEEIVAEIESERGFALHPAWKATLLVLMKSHGVDTPAINRIVDTLVTFERAAGRLPPASPLDLS